MKTIFLLVMHFFLFTSLMGDEIVIVGNKEVPKLSRESISKIYTGKLAMMDNIVLIPLDRRDDDLESKFLLQYLDMAKDKYIAYWTVRQYIGKGTAPKTVDPAKKLLEFVRNTKGAIGYVTKNELANNPTEGVVTLFEQ